MSRFLPIWLFCLLVAALAISQRGIAERAIKLITSAPSDGGGIPIGVWALLVASGMLAFYYLTSIPDTDDSLNLNITVGAITHRSAVFAHDTMLGLPGLAFIKSTYCVESYQLLTAILSDITRLPVIVTAHALVPAFAIAFTASILVLIHRALFANDWLIGAATHLAWLVVLDGSLQSYDYYSIPRYFQGKAVFVTAMAPLIAVLTILAVRNRSRIAVGLIAAATVMSIGFTANAIYAAPLTTALTAAPMFLMGNAQRRRDCLRLVLTIVYPAAIAGYLLLFKPPHPSQFAGAGSVGLMLWDALGSPAGLAGGLALLFAAAGAGLFHRALMGVSLYVLILLAVVLNPFLWQFYGSHVTGNINYRLLWAVPLPFIAAVITSAIWRSARLALRMVIATSILAAMAGPNSILRHVAWGPSLVKVPQPEYRIARAANSLSPKGGLVLAPEEIAAWIPTLDDARPVVEARAIYLSQRAADMPPDQYALRMLLFYWVSGFEAAPSSAVKGALKTLNVQLVVVPDSAKFQLVQTEMRENSAYGLVAQLDKYLVFARR